MLSVEYEEPRDQGPCPCCGGRTTSLTRFVHKDGKAHAVYLATFSDNHPEKTVSLAVGAGQWGEGTSATERVAIALQLRHYNDGFAVSVVDGSESPSPTAAFLGRSLSREEALAHPLIKEVFKLTDHMVLEDEPIRTYLASRGDA
jgi:hypothetical protein